MSDELQPTTSGKPLAEYYGEHYYAHYSHDGSSPYRRGEPAWTQFFGEIARQIATDLRPRNVLDAGCAIGLLVEALRDRGVEAWGIDYSRYAIGQVREDVRQFCRVGSVVEDLGRDYDLITCIEVLEHLPPQQAEQAVANFAGHAEMVLLSSTPDDFREPTHLNVQPVDYWVGLFARHGMFRDLDFDAYFVSGHAILFRHVSGVPVATLRAYERQRWQLVTERRDLRAALLAATDAQANQAMEIEHLQTERRLLSGEVNYWEWQNGMAGAALEAGSRPKEPADAHSTEPAVVGPHRQWSVGAALPSVPGLRHRLSDLRRRVLERRQPGSISLPDLSVPVEAGPFVQPRSPDVKRVLFISDGADGPRRYRCVHQAEALARLGWSTDVIVYEDRPLTDVLAAYDAFVVSRLPLRPNLESLLQIAHELRKPVIYDTDDLLFNPRFAPAWGPYAAMSAEDRQSLEHGMWRNGQALRRTDAVVVSTEPLSVLAGELHARVRVSHNAVGQAMVAAADSVLANSPSLAADGAMTLRYLSGTATHQRDFAQAAEALRWALAEYASTRLLIVGLLDLPADFGRFADRIERLDLQPWEALPSILARVAINLAPLEAGNSFTDAKSCVKYLEAGLVAVPTIASPRPDFVRVIRNGHNGMLAESAEEWTGALRTLIESPPLRAQMGARARQDVRLQHTSAARGQQLQDLLHELLLVG